MLLHVIAAAIWVVTLLFAFGVGSLSERDDNAAVGAGVLFVLVLAGAAFTLQVLA